MSTSLYPKSPVNVPKELTQLPLSYKVKATLAVLAILLFFSLYIGLILSIGYLVYYAFSYEMRDINKLTILLKLGAIAGSGMLLVFTVKFMFKIKNHKPQNRIPLEQHKYPELWSFIHQICAETGSPKPKMIFADPDVNAYVSYTNMWLSLFLPVKKELTIGLGLVNCLDLQEFKAVIAHEFGHFSQRSMKIGSYIISANTIIHDMIFSRDKWDEALVRWRASDIRLSFVAWIITPIIWCIRQLLNLFYRLLNLMHSLLSREMEFNADRVAVSTSGSVAIVAALWKLDPGSGCWNSTMNYAYLAAQKRTFAKNLYYHNSLEIERKKTKLETELAHLPTDENGVKRFFSTSESSNVSMYASHPPNDKRENNAKELFIACEEDNRSPWLLFDTKERLQEEMTTLIYFQYLGKKQDQFMSEGAFELFINDETKGNELMEEYLFTFSDRFITIPSEELLQQEVKNIYEPDLFTLNQLKLRLAELMAPVREIESAMQLAQQIAEGTVKTQSVSFKNATYTKKNLQEGYAKMTEEREKLFSETFIDWDSQFCAFYLSLAKKFGKETELLRIYKQQATLIQLYKSILDVKNKIVSDFNVLQTTNELTESDVTNFGIRVNKWMLSLNEGLDELNKIDFAPLPNIQTLSELKEAIVENGKFNGVNGLLFENGGFDTTMHTIESAIKHCHRIEQKGIAVILSFQHEMHV